jgi:hypothetical protein
MSEPELLDDPGIGFEMRGYGLRRERRRQMSECKRQQYLVGEMMLERGTAGPMG